MILFILLNVLASLATIEAWPRQDGKDAVDLDTFDETSWSPSGRQTEGATPPEREFAVIVDAGSSGKSFIVKFVMPCLLHSGPCIMHTTLNFPLSFLPLFGR